MKPFDCLNSGHGVCPRQIQLFSLFSVGIRPKYGAAACNELNFFGKPLCAILGLECVSDFVRGCKEQSVRRWIAFDPKITNVSKLSPARFFRNVEELKRSVFNRNVSRKYVWRYVI